MHHVIALIVVYMYFRVFYSLSERCAETLRKWAVQAYFKQTNTMLYTICNLCYTFTSRNLGMKRRRFFWVGIIVRLGFSTQHMFPLFSADLKLSCLPLLWAMLRSRVTDAIRLILTIMLMAIIFPYGMMSQNLFRLWPDSLLVSKNELCVFHFHSLHYSNRMDNACMGQKWFWNLLAFLKPYLKIFVVHRLEALNRSKGPFNTFPTELYIRWKIHFIFWPPERRDLNNGKINNEKEWYGNEMVAITTTNIVFISCIHL